MEKETGSIVTISKFFPRCMKKSLRIAIDSRRLANRTESNSNTSIRRSPLDIGISLNEPRGGMTLL